MSDITWHLRVACGHDSRSVDGCVTCEAADEIERLRALAADRLEQMQADRGQALRWRDAAQQARDALNDCNWTNGPLSDALRALDAALKETS